MSTENSDPKSVPEREENAAIEENKTPPPKRRWFSARNLLILAAIPLALILILALVGYLAIRTGYVGNQIKNNFVAQMSKFGIRLEIGSFETTFSPLGLKMRNVELFDAQTGEKLVKIDNLNVDATITDLYALNFRRNIRLDSTDIDGIEVWARFDENGRSNFFNLKIPEEEETNLKISYSSMKLAIQNGVIHYGDKHYKLSGKSQNIKVLIEPENPSESSQEIANRRFKFDFSTKNSTLSFEDKPVTPIDLAINGVATESFAEINSLRLQTPLAESKLSGQLENWEKLRYNLKIESTVDLTQTNEFLPTSSAIRGVGNFSGTVTGEGEKYKINGEIQSDALAADNVRLKALQVNGTLEGENSTYEANGKAVAELLTAGDFQLNLLQIMGQVTGTGTDFRWIGELQAAAARAPNNTTIAGLILKDAVAEYKDKKFSGSVGTVTAREFYNPDAKINGLQANGAKINSVDGVTNAEINNVRANSVQAKDTNLRGVTANNVKIRDENGVTNVEAGNLTAQNVENPDAKINGLTAQNVEAQVRDNGAVEANARNVRADNVQAQGATVKDLNAVSVNVQNQGNQTNLQAENLQVGGVETEQVVLGNLNIAGVRLKIVEGRIEGSSGDINAGNVTLNKTNDLPQGGKLENVKISRPEFVLEPSGRYRASLDLSLGGGVLGSVQVGAARATVNANNDQVELNNLSAQILEGQVNGRATVALTKNNQSKITARFENLDLAKVVALQGGRVIPLTGKTSGDVNLNFPGTNFRAATGTLTADFKASAGNTERGLIPLNGKLGLKATNGLFDIDFANFNTEKTAFNAKGRFDLDGNNSNLQFAVNSTDASEAIRIVKAFNLSPELEEQLAENQIELAGNLTFNGTLRGNLQNPTIDGRAALDALVVRGRNLGSLSTDLSVAPGGINLTDALLAENGGGTVRFSLDVPATGKDNIAVNAVIDRVNTGNIFAALPIQNYLPEGFQDIRAEASGKINITGIPNNLNGTAELNSSGGAIGNESFDSLTARLTFQNTLVNIENFEIRQDEGLLTANGTYEGETAIFNLKLRGEKLQIQRLRSLFGTRDLPDMAGVINTNATATGEVTDFSTFNISFDGVGRDIALNGKRYGNVNFVGRTQNQQLVANLTADINGTQQLVSANVNFADKNLPIRLETVFNQTELAPFITLFVPNQEVEVTGRATGTVFLAGNLYENGKFTTGNLSGEARFTELSIQVQDTPLTAVEPIFVRFTPQNLVFENAKFAGAGSNLVVGGTKALADNIDNDLTINGRINLRILNTLSRNQFFGGLADLNVRLVDNNANSRLAGSVKFNNSTFSTIISDQRLNFTNIEGRVLFNSNQAQIDRLTANLGGGRVTATGGAVVEDLKLQQFRLDLVGRDVSAPLPRGFNRSVADAEISITGRRISNKPIPSVIGSVENFETLISGNIYVKRATYTQDVDVADFISDRDGGTISYGTGEPALGVPQLRLRVEGRDALIIRNNVADLTASFSLNVTGDVNEPVLTGRVIPNGGTLVLFNNTRYDIQRGYIEFPQQRNASPIFSLQAEADINGYQVLLDTSGSLDDLSSARINLRSNPSLPQADVVSLITTGSLSNTDGGIPTLAQTGLNTAANVLTESLINSPVRRATDKLFGLNKFEIDPILTGQRGLNPSARLTVGRQINRNLAVTYSTNLSADRNQVLAFEYRVSNRLSFVAQYEQGSLNNVTRNNDNFSFEVRFRRRF